MLIPFQNRKRRSTCVPIHRVCHTPGKIGNPPGSAQPCTPLGSTILDTCFSTTSLNWPECYAWWIWVYLKLSESSTDRSFHFARRGHESRLHCTLRSVVIQLKQGIHLQPSRPCQLKASLNGDQRSWCHFDKSFKKNMLNINDANHQQHAASKNVVDRLFQRAIRSRNAVQKDYLRKPNSWREPQNARTAPGNSPWLTAHAGSAWRISIPCGGSYKNLRGVWKHTACRLLIVRLYHTLLPGILNISSSSVLNLFNPEYMVLSGSRVTDRASSCCIRGHEALTLMTGSAVFLGHPFATRGLGSYVIQ